MSLTIEQSPETYSPVFNPMNFVVSSDAIAGNNYFFYLVRIKNSAGDIISQHRYAPRPDNTYLLFDASRMLEKYTSYDISGIASGTTGVRQTSNVFKEYTIQFVEEFGSVASGIASGAASSTSTMYAFNAALDSIIDYDDADYLIATTGTNQFLTDMRGGNIRLKDTDSFEIGIMTGAGAGQPVKSILIKTYSSAGSLLGTYKIANSYSAGTATEDKFLSCLVGAGDLNGTTLSSGSQPIITDSVKTYTVQVENNSSTVVSETLTFEIDRTCNTGIRLYWLNRLGRIDAFNFQFENDRSIEVIKSNFRKLQGAFSGAAFGYTTYETGNTNFSNTVERKIKVRTDFISNIEAEWLQYLVSSPICWGVIDGELISLSLDTSSYTIQTIEKNKLFSVEFDLTFSNSVYRQRL